MSTLQSSLSTQEASEAKTEAPRYGTFFGVFLPSALSIFGVIMYLRLGTILGNIGLVPTLSIISIASLITFITALSISTVATNMKIKKGGAYYIISRSLGIDFGTAIGIPIYLAQAFGIAFYILGFSETLHAFYPAFDEMQIRMGTLLILGMLGFFSTNIVLKTQFLIFLAILASLVSIVIGDPIMSNETVIIVGPKLGYWAAFAIFFPAVTGIEAGVSMSGVLKNPRKSLPIGSIVSVLVGLVAYSLLAWLLWERAPQNVLATDSMVCAHLAKYSSLIILGIWGATLSSALGGLLGAPRTLQALGEDGVLFRFLGKESRKKQEPRVAFLFTRLLVAPCLYFGKIDLISPLLTMFFLISYGILNLVAGMETLIQSPSWRPSFSVPAIVSLSGALLCLMAMFMINPGATFISTLVVFCLYFFRGRKLSANWDHMCSAIMMYFSRSILYRLMQSKTSAHSWRPHLQVLSSTLTPPNYLLDFTQKITKGNSFLSFCNIIDKKTPCNCATIKKSIFSTLKKRKLQAFVDVRHEEHVLKTYK
ncbi:MAG: Na-K-Cl cotransporter, partial [Gammaproteobacteria bacterium]|nr:Na-K-Cl cotransporter [Gammaproteobacteria bacterium]